MNFPRDDQHLSVIGANGSGKTQAALFHLSNRDYVNMPWLVINYKNDASIDAIPKARHIDVDELPTRPGVYIVHPLPDADDEGVNNLLWAIWRRGNTGVYVDEGYMIGNRNRAFRALLTQGRSKRIPLIVLSQRPVWLDPFVFTESQFYQVFRLQHIKDVKKCEEFIPGNLGKRLPDYHSYYYDVSANKLDVLSPVPAIEEIHKTFDRRIVPPKPIL